MGGAAAGLPAGAMLLSGGADVDFFIHSYYEFELFWTDALHQHHDDLHGHCLPDIVRADPLCEA